MSDSAQQSPSLHGATLTPVANGNALNWIQWVTGESPIPTGLDRSQNPEEFAWLLAHCVDGVTWGRRDAGGAWQLSSSVFPELCPPFSGANLLELRLFGPNCELLLWRDDCDPESRFRGRWLVDDGGEFETTDPYRPHTEDRFLFGDQILDSSDGFTRIGDGAGREQAVPIACAAADTSTDRRLKSPLRLRVRHYFTTDRETGAVRVAASRLVHVFNAASQGHR